MGDVYWMTSIFVVQAIVSTIVCAVLAKKTESVVDDTDNSKDN